MITNDIRYIGVNDHEVDLFEGQYVVPNGMSYNSYAILDDKIAIMDTVDSRFIDSWLQNIRTLLGQREPDSIPELFGGKRAQAGYMAPAQGLCLMEVYY